MHVSIALLPRSGRDFATDAVGELAPTVPADVRAGPIFSSDQNDSDILKYSTRRPSHNHSRSRWGRWLVRREPAILARSRAVERLEMPRQITQCSAIPKRGLLISPSRTIDEIKVPEGPINAGVGIINSLLARSLTAPRYVHLCEQIGFTSTRDFAKI
jgi:hypothetical protein